MSPTDVLVWHHVCLAQHCNNSAYLCIYTLYFLSAYSAGRAKEQGAKGSAEWDPPPPIKASAPSWPALFSTHHVTDPPSLGWAHGIFCPLMLMMSFVCAHLCLAVRSLPLSYTWLHVPQMSLGSPAPAPLILLSSATSVLIQHRCRFPTGSLHSSHTCWVSLGPEREQNFPVLISQDMQVLFFLFLCCFSFLKKWILHMS